MKEKSNPTNPEYIQSGIDKKDNTDYYIMGNQELYFFFTRNILNTLKAQKKAQNKITEIDRRSSIGFSLSIEECYQHCFAYVKNNKHFIKDNKGHKLND